MTSRQVNKEICFTCFMVYKQRLSRKTNILVNSSTIQQVENLLNVNNKKTMESSRRQQAQNDLGMNFEREDLKRNAALAKEQERVAKKQAKREQMMNRSSYRMMVKTAKYMDKYYLDPLIGLIPGGVGDTISSLVALPFIYYSLCVVKSIPLTLAVIYNILIDVMLGAIPVIGNLFDILKRSYVDNLRLITGYIEDDKEIISKVRKKAFWTAVFIVVLCWLIYVVISWAIRLGTMAYDWIGSLF